MTNELQLIITTPERVVYQDIVESVTLPTLDGEITILPNHVPLVSVLKAGELLIRKGGDAQPYAIGGGFIEVDGKKLTILADTAEHVAEIDEQKAEEARHRAEKLKAEKRVDTEEYASLAAKLDRDLARLKVVRKYKHRGHHEITHEAIRKE
jgi:F-type H+-transporting ATPase subunit epsilon